MRPAHNGDVDREVIKRLAETQKFRKDGVVLH
jgi:hypothetical protein